MSDFLTIAGSQINLATWNCVIDHCRPYVRGGIPELGFSRILGKLTTLPDAWSGKTCVWSNGTTYPGTTYFSGDVVGYSDSYSAAVGWVRQYRALGLRNRADYVPVTDSNTLSDAAQYNLPSNNPATIPAREGRTMGQAVLDLLSMQQNMTALSAAGIGNYTSAGYGGVGTAVLSGSESGSAPYGYSVASISVTQPGSGYTVAPSVVLAGGGGSGANFTCSVASGQITGFSLVSGGAGYTSAPTVIISTLPTATVSDLANLTVIPPFPISFAGERIIQSIENTIQTCHPNHWVYVDVSGNIRFLDQRTFVNNTITLGGSDVRWLMPSLTRDLSDCYSSVIVRGNLAVGGVTLSLNQFPGSSYTTTWSQGTHSSTSTTVPTGGLVEDFAGWGGYTTNVAAVAAWNPADYQQLSLQGGQDHGSCTCTSTTQVQITSANTTLAFAADALDQTVTGQHAVLTVFSDVVSGVTQSYSARVISNTAMTAGGSATLTLDQALPSTNYNSYFLYALGAAGNVVWRRYYVVNRTIAAAMQQVFPYPFAFRNSQGTAAVLTSSPVCTVFNGLNQSTVGVSVDPVSGTITTMTPTSLVYGGGVVTPPTNVQVFLPVATGELQVTYPTSGQTGTLYSVEGITRTKTITVREWTDYSLTSNMQTFASEWLTSACNVVIEGTLPYLGLPTAYLSPGQAVSIAGTNGTAAYTTGYESAQLPVASVDIQFQPGSDGTFYTSVLHLSNRRQRYTSDIFMRPPARGQQIGLASGQGNWQAFRGFSNADQARAYQANQAAANQAGLDASGFGNQDTGEPGDIGYGSGEANTWHRPQLREQKKLQAEHNRRMQREEDQAGQAALADVQHMTAGQYARFRGVEKPETPPRAAGGSWTQDMEGEGGGGMGETGPQTAGGSWTQDMAAEGGGGTGPTPGPQTASGSWSEDLAAEGGGGTGPAPGVEPNRAWLEQMSKPHNVTIGTARDDPASGMTYVTTAAEDQQRGEATDRSAQPSAPTPNNPYDDTSPTAPDQPLHPKTPEQQADSAARAAYLKSQGWKTE